MPQMKGLKELKLPVRQRREDIWQDCNAFNMRFCHILFMDIEYDNRVEEDKSVQ